MVNGRKILFLLVAGVLAAALLGSAANAEAAGKVKVFIFAGQSNAEGKAPNKLLDYQAEAPETKAFYAPYREDGKWIERDDVFIKYLTRHGKLTYGYGSRGRTGSEMAFGFAMGDHFDEPVLIIKAAWGGHSLYKLFRPPSSGMPSDKAFADMLASAQDRVKKNNEKRKRNDPLPTLEDVKKPYGSSYRNMMAEVKETAENYQTMFPALKGKQLELAGFVGFQGLNDMYNGAEKEYAKNMTNFINDVRKDLKAPKLPFVIAAMGQNGSKEAKGAMLTVREAQMAMNKVPAFKGNVKAFRTDLLVDKRAEKLYPNWSKHYEEWQKVGGDRGYHYLGSGIWFSRIGTKMSESMIELTKK